MAKGTDKGCNDLPDECWELILSRLQKLHRSYLESPSLTCKRFLSITNTLRTHLIIFDQSLIPLSKLFNRYPRLEAICFHGDDLGRVIMDIATSNLNLTALNFMGTNQLPLEGFRALASRIQSLRALRCSRLGILRDIELFVIADSMPYLEELDISYPKNDFGSDPVSQDRSPGEVGVTDSGIEVLSSKLKGLEEINISGNKFLTDKSLLALSTNCVHLAGIAVLDCSLVTPDGINFVMRNSTELSSMSTNGMDFGQLGDYSVCCAKSISTLVIHDTEVPDEYLHLLAKAGIPLERFTLDHCFSFTLSGISLLFNKYRSLEFLSLTEIDFLTDGKMSDLSHCLSALVTVKVDFCKNLTESTFFTLAKNCPLVQDISMEGTNVGGGRDGATNIVENLRIKFLNLEENSNLSDACLAKLATVCPSLEVLNVSSCKGITENGIAYFLKSGSKIRKLEINQCEGIKSIGNGFELSKFEVLGAAESGINDDGLVVIGSRCCGLLDLNLDGCLGVTTVGLKEILTNCRRLRAINLIGCLNVSTETVDWMMFSRPSLRKITISYSCLPSESQEKLFWQHGCLVMFGEQVVHSNCKKSDMEMASELLKSEDEDSQNQTIKREERMVSCKIEAYLIVVQKLDNRLMDNEDEVRLLKDSQEQAGFETSDCASKE
ncbi:hypothetical protein Vadar_023657 [Vaccinium darrowii]|uniref:Uncharacterized protein n=1 Tax=Vaccinium darrowii TaxID=229202 RepID=A0ACB7Z741_9ERIC|nr:hypothetical protein Vadar_023657 [Vaccinium darrowii]